MKPFKDALFSADEVVSTSDGGAFETQDYQKMRDLYGRDEEPERRVRRDYVEPLPGRAEAMETVSIAGRRIELGRVGPAAGQTFTVIFIHGRGGDRRLGMSDDRFGGNFNRLKNLVVASGGVYYAPSVKSFDADGVSEVTALIEAARQASAGRPVVLACASMGSFICYGVSRDKTAIASLTGMVILGGALDADFPKSAFARAKKPVWFTHGGDDKVYSPDRQAEIFRALLKAGAPARFTLYRTGSHGTPVRMTDWRRVLNWILTRRD